MVKNRGSESRFSWSRLAWERDVQMSARHAARRWTMGWISEGKFVLIVQLKSRKVEKQNKCDESSRELESVFPQFVF